MKILLIATVVISMILIAGCTGNSGYNNTNNNTNVSIPEGTSTGFIQSVQDLDESDINTGDLEDLDSELADLENSI